MSSPIVVASNYPARVAPLRRRETIEIRIRVGSWRAHLNTLNSHNPASTSHSHPAGDLPSGGTLAGACCVIARLRHFLSALISQAISGHYIRLSHKHAGLALEHKAKAHHYEEKAAHCLPEMEG